MEMDKTMTVMILIELVLSFCVGWFLNKALNPAEQIVNAYEINTTANPIVIQNITYVKPTYEEIFDNVSNNRIGNWTCLNYSLSLYHQLKDAGYDVHLVCGWNQSISHAWLRLELALDPTWQMIETNPPKFNQLMMNANISTDSKV